MTMDLTGIFKAYDVRGLYPAQINGAIAERIGRAFAEFCGGGPVAVGRDMRSHSVELQEGLFRGLTAGGCEVLDLGLVSTPMC
ncbi:MAG: phosphomannomutase, partial [Lentisphaeria bacterium]|nr:phosphomannomutase [Lentisphaeria bacterium]